MAITGLAFKKTLLYIYANRLPQSVRIPGSMKESDYGGTRE